MADVIDLTSGSDQVRQSSLILALGYVRLGRVVWITICSGDGPDKIDRGKNGFITLLKEHHRCEVCESMFQNYRDTL